MKLTAIALLIVFSSSAFAQSTTTATPSGKCLQPQPLTHPGPPPFLWNSKLIRWEREGIIAPAAETPGEGFGPPLLFFRWTGVDSVRFLKVQVNVPHMLDNSPGSPSLPIFDRIESTPVNTPPMFKDLRVPPEQK